MSLFKLTKRKALILLGLGFFIYLGGTRFTFHSEAERMRQENEVIELQMYLFMLHLSSFYQKKGLPPPTNAEELFQDQSFAAYAKQEKLMPLDGGTIRDAWGREVVYSNKGVAGPILTSKGADMLMATDDDIVVRYSDVEQEGKD